MPRFNPDALARWTAGRWSRPPVQPLAGFNQDTRTLTAGQVFVALKTEKRDGHDFLAEAQAKGAAAALVSREVAGTDLPQLVTADALTAFQQIAAAHRAEFPGVVVGVTGSAGKTSTKDLLTLLLGGGNGRVLKTEGNLNNFLGVPLTLTRLDPAQHEAAVVEAGINMPDEMQGLAEMIQPDHAVVTLVGPAHLEKLGSLDGVANEKARLPAAVRAGGWQVFPVGCWAYAAFRALANPLVLVPANEAMVQVGGRSIVFTVLHRPERTEVTLGAKRTFVLQRVSGGMAQNAALALALASELGV
ncbi:MAG: Mur ligase family protein, partial [Candidatus Didemnitutus sp.]|nr:Mur ligase family protein [Candidatus Didemnitutus sp.]